MQSNTAAPKFPTYTCLLQKTVALNGSFPCVTMAWELTLSTSTGSLFFSSGCTDEKSLRAQESDWPFARNLWRGCAVGFGLSRNPKRDQPSTFLYRREMGNDGNDWKRRGRNRSSISGRQSRRCSPYAGGL